LGHDGSYIVHPDDQKLNRNVFELAKQDADPSVEEAARAMLAGETGYRFIRLNGEDCYVFYKPFERTNVPGRAMADLGWSAGIIFPADDIFGDYNRLLYMVLIIAIVGLTLLLGLCYVFIHRQFLPLRKLAVSAQRITEGNYEEIDNESMEGDRTSEIVIRRQDEIGRLQSHFVEMRRSLSTRMGEMQRLTDMLNERGEVLRAAYELAQAGESMKINFLYNMSDQMMSPVSGIKKSVDTLCNRYNKLTEEDVNRLVEDVRRRGDKVTELLNQLIKDSEKYA
jgi:methyl-accepting chemotaxis protein/sigma-B regulation protein RsbU (phosphoserine phosphatase)